jgi:hypothetical protein
MAYGQPGAAVLRETFAEVSNLKLSVRKTHPTLEAKAFRARPYRFTPTLPPPSKGRKRGFWDRLESPGHQVLDGPEPKAKSNFIILNGVKDLKLIEKRDSSLRSE